MFHAQTSRHFSTYFVAADLAVSNSLIQVGAAHEVAPSALQHLSWFRHEGHHAIGNIRALGECIALRRRGRHHGRCVALVGVHGCTDTQGMVPAVFRFLSPLSHAYTSFVLSVDAMPVRMSTMEFLNQLSDSSDSDDDASLFHSGATGLASTATAPAVLSSTQTPNSAYVCCVLTGSVPFHVTVLVWLAPVEPDACLLAGCVLVTCFCHTLQRLIQHAECTIRHRPCSGRVFNLAQ